MISLWHPSILVVVTTSPSKVPPPAWPPPASPPPSMTPPSKAPPQHGHIQGGRNNLDMTQPPPPPPPPPPGSSQQLQVLCVCVCEIPCLVFQFIQGEWVGPGEVVNQAPPSMACPICGQQNFHTQTDLELHCVRCT